MVLPVEVVNVAVSTAGTSQDVTVSGFGTPDMVRVWGVRQIGVGTGGTKDGVCISYGASDFTTAGVIGYSEEHDNASTDARRFHQTGRVVHFINPESAALELYGTVATTTDGVTISWLDGAGASTTPTEALRLVVEMWKVSGMSVSVDWVDSSGTEDGTVATSVGFEPDVLLVGSIRTSSAYSDALTSGSFSLGASWWGEGSPRNHSYNYSHVYGTGSGSPNVLTHTGRNVVNIYNGGEDQSTEWTTRNSTSYTLTTRDDSGSMKMLVCALGVGTDRVYLSRDYAKTSTGSQSHNLVFEPYWVWNLDTYAPLTDTQYLKTVEASGWSTSVLTDEDQGTVFARSGVADPTDVYGGVETGKARYLYTDDDNDPTTGGEVRLDADFDEMTTTGYDADYNTALADSRECFTLALGSSSGELVETSEETFSLSEDTGVAFERVRESGDKTTMSEDVAITFNLFDSVDDTLSHSEEVAFRRSFVHYVDDSTTLSDDDGTVAGLLKSADDTQTLAETLGVYTLGGITQQQMPKTRTNTRIYWEGTSPLLIDRVWDDYAADIVDRDKVVEIILRVYDTDSDTPNTATVELPFSAEEVLLASLSTHPSGEPDSGGYNFLHRLDGEWIPEGGRVYRVEYTITLIGDSGETPFRDVPVVFEVRTRERYSV